MNPIFKLLIFFFFFSVIVISGYRVYNHLNRKVKEAATAWGLLGYSLLMFVVFGLLVFGGIYLLILCYSTLAYEE